MRVKIAFFLSIFFLFILVTPALVTILKNDTAISMYSNLGDEEKESFENLDVEYIKSYCETYIIIISTVKKQYSYTNSYSILSNNSSYPPPEVL